MSSNPAAARASVRSAIRQVRAAGISKCLRTRSWVKLPQLGANHALLIRREYASPVDIRRSCSDCAQPKCGIDSAG